jgi:hypothetical protein
MNRNTEVEVIGPGIMTGEDVGSAVGFDLLRRIRKRSISSRASWMKGTRAFLSFDLVTNRTLIWNDGTTRLRSIHGGGSSYTRTDSKCNRRPIKA